MKQKSAPAREPIVFCPHQRSARLQLSRKLLRVQAASVRCRGAVCCYRRQLSHHVPAHLSAKLRLSNQRINRQMLPLTSRIALVTGASRGIGKSIALALAEAGADIAVNYNSNAQAAEQVCEQVRAKGRKAIPVQADVSKSPDVDRLVSTVEKQLGSPLILVNNAGIAELLPPEKVTEEIFERFLRVNLTSMFLVTQRCLPAMRAV